MKIITKPITDDKKFIEQINDVVYSKDEGEVFLEKVTPYERVRRNNKENKLCKILKRIKLNK